ncbi:nectin-4 isoform X2 [Poeciliopsis prolifica]|uniref:nectin-4 isoform X2 n=1 Tax=Poeciliopsis prolifica TaxID=188132 RepID=UPI0024143325|nr:nectin-4 isoform X2 [Poeciliopsis prolifica]
MESMTGLLLLLLLLIECVQGAFVEPLQPNTDLMGLTDTQTRLPCWYQPEENQRMVQVSWEKVFPNGTSKPIIAAHFTEGIIGLENRKEVRFETFNPISESSALLLQVTKVSDAGVYRCHIATHPQGSFDRTIRLTVWMLPISSVESENLVEGQVFGLAATCRAVGYPKPWLSWDTELPGQTKNHTGEDGKAFIQYWLHPLRSMNGKKLDCLVWHPSLKEPRRIANPLVVQYPPDPKISSSPSDWHVGLQKAELVCEGKGNPTPENVIWTRKEGALPDGVSVKGEKLIFGRPVQLNDSGTYECAVKNAVGSEKTEFILKISELPILQQSLLLIVICAVAGALVLLLLIVFLVLKRRHLRKTKKLKMELRETKEEINSLSRQASFRRLNSTGSISRIQPEDYALLRVDSHTKYSQMSLERPHYQGSQSTLGGRWGPPAEVPRDEYGRPVVWTDDRQCLRAAEMNREKEERRKRVESFVKNSNMSLDSGLPASLVPLKVQQDDGNGHKEPDLGHLQEDDTSPGDDSVVESSTTEEHEEDEGRSRHCLQGTLSKMFYESNGVLRPKENPNAIFLPSQNYYKPQLI